MGGRQRDRRHAKAASCSHARYYRTLDRIVTNAAIPRLTSHGLREYRRTLVLYPEVPGRFVVTDCTNWAMSEVDEHELEDVDD